MDRDLTRTITAEFADHQRSGFHHSLNQSASHSRATDIAKITKRALSNDQHIPLDLQMPQGIKAWSPPQVNCVNAVAGAGGGAQGGTGGGRAGRRAGHAADPRRDGLAAWGAVAGRVGWDGGVDAEGLRALAFNCYCDVASQINL